MFEIVSFSNPLVFSYWYFLYCVCYYITTKGLLKENYLSVTIANISLALIYLTTKFFEPITFPMAVVAIVVVVGVTLFVSRKKRKTFKTLASILFLQILMFAIEILTGLILFLLFGDKAEALCSVLKVDEDYKIVIYISTITFITFSLFVNGLMKIITNKKKDILNYTFKYVFFLWLPLTHVFTFIIIFFLFVNDPSAYFELNKLAAVCVFIVFIFDIATFFVVEKFERIERNNRIYEKELLQNKLDYQQTLLTKESKKEIGKVRHDILNILSTAKGFIEIGKNEKAINILQEATDNLKTVKGVPLCSNDTLNAILSIKSAQANENNIKLNIYVDESAPISIDDYSLCRVVGNLSDNAINAVKNVEKKTIKFSVEINSENLIITTENNFNSNAPKIEMKNHGKGKEIIKDIVTKYDGNYRCEIDGEIYKTVTLLKNVSLSSTLQ